MNFYWPQCDSPRMRLRKENHSLIISYDNSAGRNDGFRSWKLTKFQVLIPISLVPIRHVFLDKNHMDHMYSLLGNFETSKLGTMKWGREPFRRGKIVQRAYCNEGLPFQSTLRRICDQNYAPGIYPLLGVDHSESGLLNIGKYKKWHDFVGILDWVRETPPFLSWAHQRATDRLYQAASMQTSVLSILWTRWVHSWCILNRHLPPIFLFLPKPSEVMLPLVA